METGTPPEEGSDKWTQDREAILRSLGIDKHGHLPEEEAPPVDIDLLRRYARHEMEEEEGRGISRLIVQFRSWSDGYGRVLREEQPGKTS